MQADALAQNKDVLHDVERLATEVLKAIGARRAGKTYLVGERSGTWRISGHE